MASPSLSVLLRTKPLVNHWVGSQSPMTGPWLVSLPPPDQSPGRLWRQGNEISWEDGYSHSADLLKQFPRGRVVLGGIQKSFVTLLQKTLQWLLTLYDVPHKHTHPLSRPLLFYALLCGSEWILVPQWSCLHLSVLPCFSQLLLNFQDSILMSHPWRDITFSSPFPRPFLPPMSHHNFLSQY